MEKWRSFMEKVGLFIVICMDSFLKFKRSFSGGWDIKFGERMTPHLEGLPTAIKAQADGFFGWILILFFRGREEESTEKGKRNFSGLWGKNFSGFLEEDAALWSQALLLKGRFFQVSKAVCLSCWIYSHMCMLCSGFHSNLLILFFFCTYWCMGVFFLNGYSTILSYLSTCPISIIKPMDSLRKCGLSVYPSFVLLPLFFLVYLFYISVSLFLPSPFYWCFGLWGPWWHEYSKKGENLIRTVHNRVV